MGKTYLDTKDGLKEVIKATNRLGKKTYIEATIKDTKTQIDEKIELNDNYKLFDEIYENFNTDSPLENESIVKIYGSRNKFDFFIDFSNYLIEKINKANSKKHVSKIPQIVSNLSNYKGKHPNQRIIIEKRNTIMTCFYDKFKKNKGFSRGKFGIDPKNLY